jgi:hypothetical protein
MPTIAWFCGIAISMFYNDHYPWPYGFDLDPINLYMELRDAGGFSHAAAE